MVPEIVGKKFSRLDIVMTVDERQVDLEIQVQNEGDYPERALFHWARLYSNALPAGGNYAALPRTIVISIVNFVLFDCAAFHSEYQALEVARHTPMTDKMAFYFFELPKLPKDIGGNDLLLCWLALFKANTEEELRKIEEMEVPELTQAINAYHRVSASPEFQELERMRIKAEHDEAQALHNERRKEKFEIAKKMLKRSRPIEEIKEDTGLTHKEIESLCNAN